LTTNETLAQHLSTNPDTLSLYEQNWLTTLPTIPASVKTLAVRSCRNLVDVGKALPDGIEIINFYGASSLAKLPSRLPANLKSLMLNYCVGLTGLPPLPAGLRRLDLDDAANIVEVDGLPEELEELSLNRCRSLKRIGKLPSTLTTLCIRECSQLEALPELPPHLKTLFITNSGLKALPELPDTVHILDISGVEHLLSGKKTPKYLQSMIAFGGWLHRG
jgi:hypothetical protein